MQSTPQHFSEIIQSEYNIRSKRNEGYSIRAFARDLDLSPATLSLILKKRAGLSPKKAVDISKKLQFTGDEKDFFQNLVQSTCARSKKERQIAKAKLCRYETRYNSISAELFCVIKDWYHLAIMELTLIKGFNPNPAWIAKKLMITDEEAKIGLKRLLRLEILEFHQDKLRPSNDYIIVLSNAPSEAVKIFQTQILNKIARSFDEADRSSRDIASTIIRMRQSDVDHVKKILKDVRRDIASTVQEGENHDSVFCLTTSFFRLDH